MKIHKLFIKGNNEAATEARKRILIPRDQAIRVPCFGLVGNEATADGTLEISQDTAPDGVVTASGALMNHAGDLLWTDSKRSFGVDRASHEEAMIAANSLMYSLEDEICGIPPLIKLSKVRKIYVASPERFNNVTWKSECLTFVDNSVDADAVFTLTGRIGRKYRSIWAFLDPKNNDYIPGWETDSFQGVPDLEKAVGCH